MATIIHTNRDTTPLVDFSFESLQKAVGGWLEAVYTHSGCLIYEDEEGKIQQIPLNVRATMLSRHGTTDPIVWNVVLLTPEETKQQLTNAEDA